MFDIGFPRDWSSLKKLIWLKAAISGGGASAVWKTVTGTLIHVTDALASPMQKCEVTLEPIQDLHGQDAPYPAGGGQNILDPNLKFTSGTYYGLSFTASNNGYSFSCSGTATGSGNIVTNTINSADAVILPAGTYIITAGTASIYSATGSWIRNQYSNTPFTMDQPFFINHFYLGVVSGRTYNTTGFITLAKGSTALTEWSPYENICPITGWTGCEVNDAGKNLLNVGSNLTNRAGWNMYIPVSLKAGVTYTMSCQNLLYIGGTNRGAKVGIANSSKSLIADLHNVYSYGASVKSFSFTLTEKQAKSAEWIVIQPTSSGVTVEEISDMENMIEVGETATSYVAYSGTTLSVTFPDSAGTVYGGTVDLVSGVLTVDRAIVDMETLSWSYALWNNKNYTFAAIPSGMKSGGTKTICSQYPRVSASVMYGDIVDFCYCVNNTLIRVVDSRYTDAASFKTAMSGVQLVYELATPTEISLTPQEISTLKGVNNVWGDGNIELTYKAQAE